GIAVCEGVGQSLAEAQDAGGDGPPAAAALGPAAWCRLNGVRHGSRSYYWEGTPRQMAKTTVFVDGQEGTTGLQIREVLAARADVEVLRIDPEKRKDSAERARLLNAAD